MKKILPIFFLAFISYTSKAQDTIIGFDFKTDVNANFGTDTNKLNALTVENLNGTPAAITMTQGVTGTPDQAATTTNWDAGTDAKFWMIKVYTKGFEDISISSKQRSGNNPKGPKDFKVQYRIGVTGTWTDLTGATSIVLGNDWTSGVVNAIALPAECENIDTMVYVRWVMTSDLALDASTVQATATSKIDDIFVLGTAKSTGITNNNALSNAHINVTNNVLTANLNEEIYDFVICDISGKIVTSERNVRNTKIDISNYITGIYFIKFAGTKNYAFKFAKI